MVPIRDSGFKIKLKRRPDLERSPSWHTPPRSGPSSPAAAAPAPVRCSPSGSPARRPSLSPVKAKSASWFQSDEDLSAAHSAHSLALRRRQKTVEEPIVVVKPPPNTINPAALFGAPSISAGQRFQEPPMEAPSKAQTKSDSIDVDAINMSGWGEMPSSEQLQANGHPLDSAWQLQQNVPLEPSLTRQALYEQLLYAVGSSEAQLDAASDSGHSAFQRGVDPDSLQIVDYANLPQDDLMGEFDDPAAWYSRNVAKTRSPAFDYTLQKQLDMDWQVPILEEQPKSASDELDPAFNGFWFCAS
jgi:hypothetical protein